MLVPSPEMIERAKNYLRGEHADQDAQDFARVIIAIGEGRWPVEPEPPSFEIIYGPHRIEQTCQLPTQIVKQPQSR